MAASYPFHGVGSNDQQSNCRQKALVIYKAVGQEFLIEKKKNDNHYGLEPNKKKRYIITISSFILRRTFSRVLPEQPLL